MQKQRQKSQLGLTLLEVMIAAGVLALAMVMAMGSMLSISATTAQAEDQAAASAAVSSLIEQIRATPMENIRNFQPPAQAGMRIQSQVWVVTNNNEIALPADQNVSNNIFRAPLQVRVQVNWLDNAGRPRVLDTTTIIGD